MNRSIVYTGQQPQSADLLNAERAFLIGHAKLAADLLGSTSALATGLAATAGTGLTVSIAPGQFYGLAAVDATAYGSLTTDSHQILKQGILLDAQVLTGFIAPVIGGQSINYLIEAKYADVDTTPVVLPFYNSANPTVYFNGQSGSGTALYTLRQGNITFQVKAGTAAATGSQTTPSADSGFTPLWVVEMRTGDTTPNAGRITKHGSAPFLAGLLNQHHTGVTGQAPKIQLAGAAEVQGQLPMGNLFASDTAGQISAVQSFAGNPNGSVAGNTGVAGVSPPSMCWDTTNKVWWTCTTTGSTSTAVWTTPPVPGVDTGGGLAFCIGFVQ